MPKVVNINVGIGIPLCFLKQGREQLQLEQRKDIRYQYDIETLFLFFCFSILLERERGFDCELDLLRNKTGGTLVL